MSVPVPGRAAPGRPDDPAGRLHAGFLRFKGALFDPVTGLSSYLVHLEDLQLRLEGRPLGVLVVAFPRLAALERAWGWEAGDRFLAGAGAALGTLRGRGLPASTVVGLDGAYGNAFLLFLPEGTGGEPVTAADLAEASAALNRLLRARLAGADWVPPSPSVSFTVGYALVPVTPTARFERLVHQGIAEARSMTFRAADRLAEERATELRRIIREARITTHYQPIVDLDRGSVMGYEALTRGPAETVLEVPKALFDCSCQMRLATELDALCRRQALRNARGFDRSKKLFLNALPETLGAPGFLDSGLLRVLDEMALRPGNIVLEITEGSAIEDFEAFGRELGALRRHGFLVALDDVGRGYSSLQGLTEIQPDFLKIDISLIKNIHRSLIKQDLVRSLLQAGARLGAQVIAEGIETAEECRAVRACGVRFGQGFYLARPAPGFATLRPAPVVAPA